jgi:hypothetical protein
MFFVALCPVSQEFGLRKLGIPTLRKPNSQLRKFNSTPFRVVEFRCFWWVTERGQGVLAEHNFQRGQRFEATIISKQSHLLSIFYSIYTRDIF